MSKSFSRAPRRRIERVRNTLVATVTNTQTDDILHTCEDAKTLIRASLRFMLQHSTTGVTRGEAVLHIRPAGTAIVLPSVTEQLDQDTPVQEILRFPFMVQADTTAATYTIPLIDIDTKAMRKLKAGDEVVLSWDSNTANAMTAQGVVYLWFKE